MRAGTGGPKLESITPADGAARVPITQDLVLNFNADMATGSGEIRVVRSSDNATAQTIPVLSADVTAAEENVTVALAELDYGTNYHVVITEGALTDLPREIELIFIQVTEGFSTYMRVCLVAGIVVAMPILVYQMIMFILPALTSRERRAVFIIMPWITLMFAGGIYFGYTYLLPPALNFLLTFPSDIASAEIRMGDYVAFVSRLLLVIGVIFELPVISSFLARMGVIDHKWLASRRRWNILLSFVVAAVITPTPDPMNQSAVAGTLVVLYELSVWLALIFQKRRPKSEFDKLMQEEGEYTPKPDATPPGQEES